MSSLIGSISYIILWLSNDIYQILIARLLSGVAIAFFIPSSIASVIDQAENNRIGEALGWRSLMVGLGYTIGPGVGGFLAEILGYKSAFLIGSIILLTITPFLSYHEQAHERNKPIKIMLRDFIKLAKDSVFIRVTISLTLYAMSYIGLITFLSTYLKIKDYGDIVIGLFVSVMALASLIFRVAGGKLSDKHPKMITLIGLIIVTIGFSIVPLNPLPPNIYIASVIIGIGYGLYIPSSQTLALSRSKTNGGGFLSGILTMGYDIGLFIGP